MDHVVISGHRQASEQGKATGGEKEEEEQAKNRGGVWCFAARVDWVDCVRRLLI
jgi:hypothetical protein